MNQFIIKQKNLLMKNLRKILLINLHLIVKTYKKLGGQFIGEKDDVLFWCVGHLWQK